VVPIVSFENGEVQWLEEICVAHRLELRIDSRRVVPRALVWDLHNCLFSNSKGDA
jgi:hypothetical protein